MKRINTKLVYWFTLNLNTIVLHLFLTITMMTGLTSCFTFKDITQSKPVTQTMLEDNINPGKTYQIQLNTGMILTVKVDSVDSLHIYGMSKSKSDDKRSTYPFSDTFLNLSGNANKISEQKFNPLLTTVAIVVPVASLWYLAIYSDEWWENQWKKATK